MKRPWSWLILFLLGGMWWISSADTRVLHVVFSAPHDQVKKAEDGIVVTFDQPMVELGPAGERARGPLQLEPPIPGVYRWLGVRTLAFYPKQLAPATHYTATVPAGTKAANGAVLAEKYSFEFQTGRPEIEDSPAQVWQGAHPKAEIRFNMPMDPVKAAPFLSLRGGTRLKVRSPRPGEVEHKPEQVLIVEPASLPKPGDYELRIAAGTLAAQGNLGLAEARGVELTVPGPLRLLKLDKAKRHDPGEPLEFTFSNPVTPKELNKHLKLSPPARLTGSYPGPRLYYDLRPDTRYQLTITPGLTDEYGFKLNQAMTLDVSTDRLPPAVIAPVGERILEAYLPAQLPLGFLNIAQMRVRGARLTRDTVVPALQKLDTPKWVPSPAQLDRRWAPGARRNILTYRPLELNSLLKSGFGLMALRFEPSDGVLVDTGSQYQSSQKTALVQVTRMGLTAKFSPDDVLLWVTDLENCASLPGTAVEMRDANNKVLWNGKTDQDGLARAPGWLKLGRRSAPVLYLIAQRGPDLAVVSSSSGSPISDRWMGFDTEYSSAVNQETLVFSDRGIYRPGDQVHLKGIRRQRQGSRWSIPQGALKLVIKNSRDEEAFTQDVKLSERGSFDVDVALPKEAPTGAWRVQVDGEEPAQFQVQAYRPVQFQVGLKPAARNYSRGETLHVPIEARYLFGAPLAAAELQWLAYARIADFESSRWPGWSFGPERWLDWSWDDQDRPREESLRSQVETQLDAQGQTSASVPLKFNELTGPVDLTLRATVSSPDKSEVSHQTVVHVHPAAYYVGLRPQSSFVGAHSPLDCKVIAIDPEGAAQSGHKVEVELLRHEYHSVRRQVGNATEWVSQVKDVPVDKASLTSGSAEQSVRLKTAGPGLYLLRGRSRDASGRLAETTTSLYGYGQGSAGWYLKDDRLQLVPDKRSYKPGETVRLAVSSPFPQARLLVTVERDGILERFVSEIKGGAPVVNIPVRDDYAPNVFVSVALIQGRLARHKFGSLGEDLARPVCKLGTVKIPVDSGGQRLQVEIKSDHEVYAPGDTVQVDLQVRDAAGQPAPAEVTFVAADAGVLNLIDYHLPDPIATFFRPRHLSVNTAETRYRVVGQRRYGEKGNPGGGGAEAPADLPPQGDYRWNFEATPCWKPSLQTDAQGRARVTFKLPDSLTAFRLSAIAHQQSQFGRGEGEIRVSRALALTPSWPRFCNLGDESNAGVTVHNQSGADGTVQLELHAQGAELTGPAQQQIPIPSGQSRVVRFPFRAAQAGQATFRFQARLGQHSDRLEGKLPIQIPRLVETAAARESVEQEPLAVELAVPPEAIPGTARLDVALSSSALAGLKPAVEYLKAYPYECLEQKTSRVMPMVAAREVIEAFSGDKVGGRHLVQEVLDSLPGLQTPTGGLSLWAGNPPSPWATAYALHLCARARNQGYRLPQATVDKALTYLEQALADSSDSQLWAHRYSQRESLSTQAYMLKVLSLWGKDDASSANRLYAERSSLPVAGQAWLLSAMAKRPKESEALARQLLSHLALAPTSAHFRQDGSDLYRTYESPVRTSALALETLLETGHDFPQAGLVVHWLARQRKQGRWDTTQENAAVFNALSAWYRKHESLPPAFEATLALAGQPVLQEKFQGRSLNILSSSIPLGPGPQPLRVSREGNGTLYLSAQLKYAPRQPLPAADAGLSIVKQVEVVGAPSSGDYAAGTLLRVRLTVASSQSRSFVVVNDPVAAGMEVVQTHFATERQDLESDNSSWWGGFNHHEIYDDRVLLFADDLDPGVHRFSYYLRAAFPGRYKLLPSLAECMYEPEIFGRTGPTEVVVR
ncbi:MAG: Ig-like domain-containing protein [Candidatus Eremiobacteraeota bacterium]|nr:Ig-like domain-containing protein [Candidatus Eremiobacteraeota bacterium]MCW5868398.1 Ig-like domain-containing protein [Candidatus Eremiobacteraeota bacterium]